MTAVKPHTNGKAPDKTAGKTAGGRPFAKGLDPRRGVGKKGRSGRKTDEWKAFCQAALSDPAVRAAIKRAVRDPETRGYPNLLKLLASYAEGVPAQQIKVSGDENEPVVIRVVRDDPVGTDDGV